MDKTNLTDFNPPYGKEINVFSIFTMSFIFPVPMIWLAFRILEHLSHLIPETKQAVFLHALKVLLV